MINQNGFEKILAKPAQRALARANIENWEQLSKFTVAEIMGYMVLGKMRSRNFKLLLRKKDYRLHKKIIKPDWRH